MKFMAGASVGIMATPLPWKVLDDVSIWTQNWPWIPSNQPGESTFVHATSKTCPSCVGMKVRLVNGRPVRALPNPEHPLGGGITSLAVAEVQMLHSPARVAKPLRRSSDGAYTEISWEEAEKIVLEKLKAAKGKTAFVSSDETGSVTEVLSGLAAGLGSDKVFFMPSDGQAAAKACELMGISAHMGYDLEHSDYVLAIGADILESWGTVARNRRIFAHSHPHPEKDAKANVTFAYAGPVQNNTAAVARPWLPILPGTEIFLALGIANQLIAKGNTTGGADFDGFTALAAKYTPEETARITGLPAKSVTAVVDSLLAAKAPLVIVGSPFNQGSGAAPLVVGFAVNALLGNINKKGGLTLLPDAPTAISTAKPRAEIYKNDLVAYLAGKDLPAVLVLHEANPLYALPDPETVKGAFAKIPFKVSCTSFMDESAAASDIVLPIAMGLERQDDICNPYGCGAVTYCDTTAAVSPPDGTPCAGSLYLGFANKLGIGLGASSWQDVLKMKAKAMGANFDILMKGQPLLGSAVVNAAGYSLRPTTLTKALSAPKPGELRLTVYSKLALGTAKTGIPPFNTKTIRAQELSGSTMTVMMNKAAAARQNLTDGDPVRISLPGGGRSIAARLRVYEGVTPDTIAVCLGYGHTALDEFSQNKGANVMQLLTASTEPGTGLAAFANAVVVIAKA
jgi:anaerobic selenocysteine-containing dehydrogenase